MNASSVEEQIVRVLSEALEFVHRENIDVHTFSFYLDHESRAISVCIDTLENSARQVLSENEYSSKHFHRILEDGNLESAALWRANPGRNLSLGDYQYVNVAREDLVAVISDDELCSRMAKALVEIESDVASASSSACGLLLTSSLPNDELGLTWTIFNDEQRDA